MSSEEPSLTRAAALKGIKHVLKGIERMLKWLSDSSNLGKSDIDQLQEQLDELRSKATNDKTPPTKAISELTLREVEELFKIRQVTPEDPLEDHLSLFPFDTMNLIDQQAFQELLDVLRKTLQWFESAHHRSNQNEALVRVRLNQFLGLTLGFAKDVHIVKDQPEEKALSWGYEALFRRVARVGRALKTLSGRPDYALWYGDESTLETNLLIVEAKTSLTIGVGEQQLLAYMGLVYSGRKELNKHDVTVYGILTDSRAFHFYRISRSGKWSKQTWHWGQDTNSDITIICLLLTIMHKASDQSPTATGRTSLMSGGRQSSIGRRTLVADGTHDGDTRMPDMM